MILLCEQCEEKWITPRNYNKVFTCKNCGGSFFTDVSAVYDPSLKVGKTHTSRLINGS